MTNVPLTPTYSELAAGHCDDNRVIGRLIAERDAARAERDAAQVAIAGLAGLVAERDAALAESERLISVLESWCADPPAEMEDDGGWVDVVAVSQVQGLVDDWRKTS